MRDAFLFVLPALYSTIKGFFVIYSMLEHHHELCDSLAGVRGKIPHGWLRPYISPGQQNCTYPEDPRLTEVLAPDFDLLHATSEQQSLLNLLAAERDDVIDITVPTHFHAG